MSIKAGYQYREQQQIARTYNNFSLEVSLLLKWFHNNHLGGMREVIFVNVGGAGVKMGDQQWRRLAAEHCIDNQGNKLEQTCFNDASVFYQKSDGKKVPRNMFVDTGPEDVDEVRTGCRRNLYNRRNSVSGKEDSANYCVRGMYTIGKMLREQVLDKIRIQVQACDHFGGIVFNCSMSGGTGSGMTNLLADNISINHPKTTSCINMAIPSPKMTDIIVEPYNFVFSAGQLMAMPDNNRFVIGYDSERMYKTCENEGIDQPGQYEVNDMIASTFSTLTSRFRSKEGSNLFGDINTNLIPYKKMFFLSPSYVKTKDISQSATFAQSLYESSSCLNSYRSIGSEIILSNYAILRGQITHFQALTALNRKKKLMNCLQWFPTHLKVNVGASSLRRSSTENCIEGTMLVNSNSILNLFSNQADKFDRLYQRRAFIHWYVGQGIDNGFINENRERIEYLKRDYQQMT